MNDNMTSYPLSFPQKSLWLISQSGVDNGAYNLHISLKMRTNIQIHRIEKIFQEAMETIISRHGQTRANFILKDEEPVQIIRPAIDFKIQLEDCTALTGEELDNKIREYSLKPFNLEKDILFRLFLLHRNDNEIMLLLICHHIIYDGVSAGIFFKELFDHVRVLVSGQSLKEYSPAGDYLDFVDYEKNLINGTIGERRLQYWKDELQNNTGHSGIPADFIRPPVFSHKGKSRIFRVNNGISGFKEHTAFTVLLGAYYLLLFFLTGNDDITVVIPMMNREDNAFMGIVGYFVNMSFIRLPLNDKQTFSHLLNLLEDKIKKARKHIYPFQLIFNRLGFRHEANRFPLSDLFFSGIRMKYFEPHDRISLGDRDNLLDIEFPAIRQQNTPGDITIQLYEYPGSHSVEIRYRPELFKEETIERLIDNYQDIVNTIVQDPGASVSDILKNLHAEGMPDRRAELQGPGIESGESGDESRDTALHSKAIAAPDPIHQMLINIWKEVLNQRDISIHDDFFSLGGQSLMALMVIARVNKIFNINLSVRSFFENLTIEKFSAVIKNSLQGNQTISLPPIESAGLRAHYPLSFSQERMWFLHELEPESIAYNFTISLRLTGIVNVDVLVESYKKLIQRHDQLHSNFSVVDGRPVQIIHDDYSVYCNIVDLGGLIDEESEMQSRRIVGVEVTHCFNLRHEPLVRLTVISLDKKNHIVLLNMHHIISDEWSLSVMTYELIEIYKSSGTGNLEPLPVRYVDFSVWQRNVFSEEAFVVQREYWKHQLCELPVLQLPIDKKRPTIQTYNGSYFKEKIPESLVTKLHEAGSRHGVTVYMILLTCFYILLYRYSGQEDIPVGSPVANRTRIETEGLVGTFVNTLVLRGDMHGNPSFAELLLRIKETVIGAFTHQDLPFERLVEELRPKRDMSILPLAQVLFNVANVPFIDNYPEDIKWKLYEVEDVGVQFDLVMAIEYEFLREAALSYNRDLFEPATARQMLGHYFNVLEAVLADNEAKIRDIDLLTPPESHKLLVEWNKTSLSYPRDIIYPQAFEGQVARNPDKTAVVYQDTSVTYGELNRSANRLARYLVSQKLGHGSLIGIYLNRSDEMLVCLLAVMKIGGSYIPLDPTYPDERIAFMIEDSRINVIISDSTLSGYVDSSRAGIIQIDRIDDLGGFDDSDVRNDAGPRDLAYTIYTSGSTGRPKGVQIEHGSLLNFLYSMKEKPGITGADRLCAVTPLSFDISVLELFLPLLAGATVIIAPRDVAVDGSLLLKYIKDHNATIMQATPSTWRMLLDAGWRGEVLHEVLCGGEPIPPDLVENILNTGLTIWNLYGPTETTVWSTLYHIENKYDPILIGKPIGNTEVYILDSNMKPVPAGVPGELFIGGDGVARGYLNRPELTSEKFVPNPFAEGRGGRIYRTGDLVRYRHNGTIEFIGRNDQQVKVRGHRIELGEINTVVSQYAGIKYSATIVREDRPGDKRIVSYIIKDEGSRIINQGDLRDHVKKLIPAYMVPSFFIEMESFPQLPNGKINTKALPAPDTIEISHEIVKPQNPEQETLLAIWQEVMNVKQISIRDNFFDLGGYSLLAVSLVAKINEAFKLDLPLRTFFMNPDIEALSRVIMRYQKKADVLVEEVSTGDEHAAAAAPDRQGQGDDSRNAVFLPASASLFPMQPRGNRPLLFIVSGVHAEPDGFYRYLSCIIPSLGLDQPVYGLRPRGLLGGEKPHATIKKMAADYIQEIKMIQPEGPYYIGGECIGGLAAYEIARQLESNNEDVGVLLLFDTFYVSPFRNLYFSVSNIMRRYMTNARRVMLFLVRNDMNIFKGIRIFITRKYKKLFPDNEADKKLKHIRMTENRYRKVLNRYRPEMIASKIVLIANEQDNALESDLGWRKLYGKKAATRSRTGAVCNYSSVVVTGNHLTRLTTYGWNTGAVIRKEIDDASLAYNADHIKQVPRV